MGLKRVMWVRRYQGQCRALRPLGHQGYRLRNHKKDQPLCSGYRCMHANVWHMVEQIRSCHRVVLHYMSSVFVGRATLLLLVHVTRGILLHAMYRASRDRFSNLEKDVLD